MIRIACCPPFVIGPKSVDSLSMCRAKQSPPDARSPIRIQWVLPNSLRQITLFVWFSLGRKQQGETTRGNLPCAIRNGILTLMRLLWKKLSQHVDNDCAMLLHFCCCQCLRITELIKFKREGNIVVIIGHVYICTLVFC